MKTLQFNGEKIISIDPIDPTDSMDLSGAYESAEVYAIDYNRSSKEPIELIGEDEDIIEFIFEDGTEWMTRIGDIEEVVPNLSLREGVDKIYIPTHITLKIPDQRGTRKFFLKFIKFFKLKTKIKKVLKFDKLGEFVDKKINAEEVLYRLTDAANFTPFNVNSAVESNYLLLIHGFSSSIKGSFGDLWNSPSQVLWTKMKSIYQQNILAYDHHTISKSPIQNTIDLLNKLPIGANLDILSSSRGGLIADLMSTCSMEGSEEVNFFSPEEIKKLEKPRLEELKELAKLAKEKRVKVHRVIRVACPARGTLLLDKRLDIFLNVILGGIGIATGAAATPIYRAIKGFLMQILKSRTDTEVFPGIAAMVPNSKFQKLINETKRKTDDELLVIEGDSRFGRSLRQSLSVILSNLGFLTQNDFVVNTNSMRFGIKRANGVRTFLSRDSSTNHFNYFKNANSQKAIAQALEWGGSSQLSEFTIHSSEEVSKQYHLRAFQIATPEINPQKEDLVDFIFREYGGNRIKKNYVPINISISHAELEFSVFPVLVGHFSEDGIVSSEKALDKALGGKLTDRYLSGGYLLNDTESVVIIDHNSTFKGGVVLGLGEAINFTEAQLRKSVENGIVKYAIYLRDNVRSLKDGKGEPLYPNFPFHAISSICIGSGYGRLDMEASLTAILFGVNRANEKILELNKRNETNGFEGGNGNKFLQPITEIEFIDRVDHVTRKAFYSLEQISTLNYLLNITIPQRIIPKHGARKKIEYKREMWWWHNLMTESNSTDSNSTYSGLRFIFSSGKSKVDEVSDHYAKQLVEDLLQDFSNSHQFDIDLSNSLYHLLIPKKIQREIRNQGNILWKMTQDTAQFPWEIIHDKDQDEEPVFVNSGMIRQLITVHGSFLKKVIRDQTALIIGDPIYEKYSQLPAALEEAEKLKDRLNSEGDWDVTYLPNKESNVLISSLLNTKYKLLHIAGHGVYNPDSGQSGIVMGNIVIGSVFFSKLPYIPEFAFINCCYSGDIEGQFEETYRDRYKIAASIGIQLIEMGVQAVVITGWAVHDMAARDFADQFYKLMLQGETFGRAVQRSRKYIYERHPYTNTWGAYQCYGDPWYTLVKSSTKDEPREKYIAEDEVLVDLHNILSKKINKSVKEEMLDEVRQVFEVASQSHLATAPVYEKMAEIYAELDEMEEAIDSYQKMLMNKSAKYSVKGLEQYCNLQIKQFVANMEKNRKEGEKFKKASVKDRKLLDNFENLLKIAPTSERYSLLGSANKRFAYVFEDYNAYLEKTVESYREALKLSNQGVVTEYTYPLANLLQAQFFLKDSNPGSEEKSTSEFLSAYDWIHKVESELSGILPGNKDFWEDIARINIWTTKILFSKEPKEVEKTLNSILKSYESLFKKSGTLKNLRSEIEQFDFLIRMFNRVTKPKNTSTKIPKLNGKKEDALKEIRNTLQNLY